jgi:hypothetical protein
LGVYVRQIYIFDGAKTSIDTFTARTYAKPITTGIYDSLTIKKSFMPRKNSKAVKLDK